METTNFIEVKEDTTTKHNLLNELESNCKFTISKAEFTKMTGDESLYPYFILTACIFKNASNKLKDYILLAQDLKHSETKLKEFLNN